jgi:carbonic anhydrase/acetyltransferase-like protein (isoleucine patch superfamily)
MLAQVWDKASIWYNVTIRGDVKLVRIGAWTNVQVRVIYKTTIPYNYNTHMTLYTSQQSHSMYCVLNVNIIRTTLLSQRHSSPSELITMAQQLLVTTSPSVSAHIK